MTQFYLKLKVSNGTENKSYCFMKHDVTANELAVKTKEIAMSFFDKTNISIEVGY